MRKPDICGHCERYVEQEICGNMEGFCVPIKEKYGWTSVDYHQKPNDACAFDYSQCSCGSPIVDGFCTDKECYGSKENFKKGTT